MDSAPPVIECHSQTLQLPDGRTLAYAEYGAPDGRPLLYFHGSPSSRLELELFGERVDKILSRLGVRVIAPDRPGMGLSSFQPGRKFLDWPDDVNSLADQLGFERFGIMSYSAGSPYALACAWKIPDRVEKVGIISGVSRPFAEPGALQGMGSTKMYWWSARLFPWLTRQILSMQARGPHDQPPAQMASGMAKPDWELVSEPEFFKTFMHVSFVESSRGGTRGPAYEARLYWKPWGFDLGEINVPVHWWHGDADQNAPFQHASYAAERLPDSELHAFPGEGHVSLLVQYLEQILETLASD